MSPWLNKTHSAWLLSQTWSWLYLTVWPEYILTTVDDCQIFKGARKYAMKYHTFWTMYVQVTYALIGCKNNNESVNLSLEKPFQVRSQIHSSSLSVNNKIKHCVSSALLLNTPPIKNLLSRLTRNSGSNNPSAGRVGSWGVRAIGRSLVAFNKVFPTISQLSHL